MNTIKKKPGPKGITFIPQGFRHVPGINAVTTRRQLDRLKDYMSMETAERPAFVRLGASVPQHDPVDSSRTPHATYAVTIDGEVSVIKIDQDPRRVHKWVQNGLRPWNMSRDFAGMEVRG